MRVRNAKENRLRRLQQTCLLCADDNHFLAETRFELAPVVAPPSRQLCRHHFKDDDVIAAGVIVIKLSMTFRGRPRVNGYAR